SQRRGPDVGGNWFAPARIAVPTAAGPQGPHFEVVADRLTRARVEPALRLAPVVASTVNHLPAQVLIPALHSQAGTVDFAATAIPGLRGSGHICGARIETSYPFGPRLGCPVTIGAQAALLVLGLSVDEYREVSAIIVYPTAMQSRGVYAGPVPGTVTDGVVPVLGEAHDRRGPVLLAWDQAQDAARSPGRGHN